MVREDQKDWRGAAASFAAYAKSYPGDARTVEAHAREADAQLKAGNDAGAKQEVAALIDQFGFDTVDIGPLGESWRIQRDTPGYGPRRTADELRRDLAAAKRPPK